MTTYIYGLKYKGDHPIFYIGQTKHPQYRLQDHNRVYGKNVRMKILEECPDTHARTRESAWIRFKLDEGCKLINYNQTPAKDCDLPKAFLDKRNIHELKIKR